MTPASRLKVIVSIPTHLLGSIPGFSFEPGSKQVPHILSDEDIIGNNIVSCKKTSVTLHRHLCCLMTGGLLLRGAGSEQWYLLGNNVASVRSHRLQITLEGWVDTHFPSGDRVQLPECGWPSFRRLLSCATVAESLWRTWVTRADPEGLQSSLLCPFSASWPWLRYGQLPHACPTAVDTHPPGQTCGHGSPLPALAVSDIWPL